MEARTENVDARSSLATWLREGRVRKQLTIEEVARITKIQLRILERLETGQYDGLPADVFVKGFVRSFAKCVGLDEAEALDRFGAATQQAQPSQGVVVAQAMVETLVPITQRKIDLFAPGTLEPVNNEPPAREAPLIEARPLASVAEPPKPEPEPEVIEVESSTSKKKRSKKRNTNPAPRSRRKKNAPLEEKSEPVVETAAEPIARAIDTAPVAKIDATSLDATVEAKSDPAITVADNDGAVDEPALAEGSQRISQASIKIEVAGIESDVAPSDVAPTPTPTEDEPSESVGTWQPTMPPVSTAPTVPWRRPHLRRPEATYVVPSLVIDDSDPDSADRVREDRLAKEPNRLSFLPPILLDREDRSARQGGLTLAVIILLIAATLTLSYLMRRPTPSGNGVTMLSIPSSAPAMLG